MAGLDALRDAVAAGEDDLLASLVVTGEPRPQRVLDDWLDQAVDTLRALGEAASEISLPLRRYAVEEPSVGGTPAGSEPRTPRGAR